MMPPKGLYQANESVSGLVNQSMPMIAIFLRNKYLAWFAFIQGVHYFLNTDADAEARFRTRPKENSALDQSPSVKLLLSLVGVLMAYINVIFPQPLTPPGPTSKGSEPASEPITAETETVQ